MAWLLRRSATISASILLNVFMLLFLYYLSNGEHFFSASPRLHQPHKKLRTDLESIQLIAKNNTAQTNRTGTPPQKKSMREKKVIQTHKTPRNHNEAAKKLPITLAQLSAGFLDHIQANNNDSGKTLVNKDIARKTDQEHRQLRYKEKLDKCLRDSFAIHKKRLNMIDTRDCSPVGISMALGRNGALKEVAISSSSGNTQLDLFVLLVFQDASSSFPPVPQHIPHDPYLIGYTVAADSFK